MNIGDVVFLKSGGPDMTVVEIEELCNGTWVRGYWFDKDSNHHAANFPIDAVEETETP